MPPPGRPERRSPRRKLRRDLPPVSLPYPPPSATPRETDGAPQVGSATGTILRERRRARSFVRDYSYVTAEVRAILLLALVVLAAITALAFLIR